MKFAILQIPESGIDPTTNERLARVAADAGWELHMADDADSALTTLQKIADPASEPSVNGATPELLQVTLSSIGDAVATADESGRVLFMNGIAEALSGWRLAEALGKPLDEVLRIVDE